MRNTLNNSETHSQWAPKWDSHSYGLAYCKLQGEAGGVAGKLNHPCFNGWSRPKAQLTMGAFSSLFDVLQFSSSAQSILSYVIYGSPEPWIPLRFCYQFLFPLKKKKNSAKGISKRKVTAPFLPRLQKQMICLPWLKGILEMSTNSINLKSLVLSHPITRASWWKCTHL